MVLCVAAETKYTPRKHYTTHDVTAYNVSATHLSAPVQHFAASVQHLPKIPDISGDIGRHGVWPQPAQAVHGPLSVGIDADADAAGEELVAVHQPVDEAVVDAARGAAGVHLSPGGVLQLLGREWQAGSRRTGRQTDRKKETDTNTESQRGN
jgi:hypothetical protein